MRVATAEQMRALDARTIAEAGIPGEVLMERAGAAVARAVRRMADHAGLPQRCLLIAGKGNNGGDAFAAARHLRQTGFAATVWTACAIRDLTGDARIHFQRMTETGIAAEERATEAAWQPSGAEFEADAFGIVVDAVLGTGLSGSARGVAACAIEWIKAASRFRPVVAADIPSGLQADTGTAEGPVVRADATVTFGCAKRGFLVPTALEYTGTVEIADIGIPDAYLDALPSDCEMIADGETRNLLRPFPRQAHKGSRGHALIVAGSRGRAGAAGLAARAALRSGAGLVTVLTARGVAPLVAAWAPEAMVHPGAETDAGALAKDACLPDGKDWNDFSAVLIGPGLGVGPDTLAWVERALAQSAIPSVLDADALTLCARNPGLISAAGLTATVTPHPGEMARLLDVSAREVQNDRMGMALRMAREGRCVTVLKGAGTTVVPSGGGAPHVNLAGNPGMACGGTGDALAGVLVGLLAQGYEPFDAARVAAHAHGRAGDIAAWRQSQAGMTANDLIAALPDAWKELRGR